MSNGDLKKTAPMFEFEFPGHQPGFVSVQEMTTSPENVGNLSQAVGGEPPVPDHVDGEGLKKSARLGAKVDVNNTMLSNSIQDIQGNVNRSPSNEEIDTKTKKFHIVTNKQISKDTISSFNVKVVTNKQGQKFMAIPVPKGKVIENRKSILPGELPSRNKKVVIFKQGPKFMATPVQKGKVIENTKNTLTGELPSQNVKVVTNKQGQKFMAILVPKKKVDIQIEPHNEMRRPIIVQPIVNKNRELTGELPSQCKFCHFKCFQEEILENHVSTRHKNDEFRVFERCELCNVLCIRKVLNKHISTSHATCIIRCELCDFFCIKTADFKSILKKHVSDTHDKMHIDPKRKKDIFHCPFCRFFKASQSEPVQEHVFVWHKNRIVRCKLCDYYCFNAADLQKHISASHAIHCKFCDFECFEEKNMTEHVSAIHDIHKHRIVSKLCDFFCYISADDQKHISAWNLYCKFCAFECSEENLITEHVTASHENRIVRCELCDFFCTEAVDCKTVLQNHISASHDEISPERRNNFRCKCCDSQEKLIRLSHELRCEICDFLCDEKKGKNTFQCTFCDFKCFEEKLLREHVCTIHANRIGRCKLCDFFCYYNKNRILNRHIFATHINYVRPGSIFTFQCKFCDFESSQENLLKEHVSANHEELISRCEQCDLFCVKTQYSQDFLTKHINATHTKRRHYVKVKKRQEFKCELCSYVSLGSRALARHVSLCARKRKRAKCFFCMKSFTDSFSLGRHKNEMHRNKQLFKCNSCTMMLTSETLLETHIQTFHRRPDIQTVHRRPDIQTVHRGPDRHLCDICGKSFNHLNTLIYHTKNMHGTQYCCDICKRTFHLKERLRTHIKNAHFKVSCDICRKSFNTRRGLKVHILSEHELRTFGCDFCGKTYKAFFYLKKHIHDHHVYESPKN